MSKYPEIQAKLEEMVTAWAEENHLLRPDEVIEVKVLFKRSSRIVVSIEGCQGSTDVNLTRVTDLGLSIRSQNCLDNAGINTVGEIRKKTAAEILAHRSFGKKLSARSTTNSRSSASRLDGTSNSGTPTQLKGL